MIKTDLAVNVHAPQASAYSLIMQAIADPSCDPAKMKALLDVRRDWMEDEARAAFNRAVVEFQQRAKIIAKGDLNNGKAYAKMDRIWREVRPLLDECGLGITWESVKTVGDICTLDGHLRHSAGHAQALHHEMPLPDKLNGQNSAQRAGAGETYAKRYATCAALGIQTGEDTDGNAPAVPADDSRIEAARAAIKAAGKDEAKACQYLRVKRLEDASADQIETLIATVSKTKIKKD